MGVHVFVFLLILLHFSRWVGFSFHGRESRETFSLTTQGHIRSIYRALRIPQKMSIMEYSLYEDFLHLNEVSTLCSLCTSTMFLFGVCLV